MSEKYNTLTTSAVYDPKYSSIGTGDSTYWIGDGPSYTGDPVWEYGKNDLNRDLWTTREWTYKEPSISDEKLKELLDWMNKHTKTNPPKNTPPESSDSETRDPMQASDDVGAGLAEMINEL